MSLIMLRVGHVAPLILAGVFAVQNQQEDTTIGLAANGTEGEYVNFADFEETAGESTLSGLGASLKRLLQIDPLDMVGRMVSASAEHDPAANKTDMFNRFSAAAREFADERTASHGPDAEMPSIAKMDPKMWAKSGKLAYEMATPLLEKLAEATGMNMEDMHRQIAEEERRHKLEGAADMRDVVHRLMEGAASHLEGSDKAGLFGELKNLMGRFKDLSSSGETSMDQMGPLVAESFGHMMKAHKATKSEHDAPGFMDMVHEATGGDPMGFMQKMTSGSMSMEDLMKLPGMDNPEIKKMMGDGQAQMESMMKQFKFAADGNLAHDEAIRLQSNSMTEEEFRTRQEEAFESLMKEKMQELGSKASGLMDRFHTFLTEKH